jgi:hypothetical protein
MNVSLPHFCTTTGTTRKIFLIHNLVHEPPCNSFKLWGIEHILEGDTYIQNTYERLFTALQWNPNICQKSGPVGRNTDVIIFMLTA